jgi:hypothetical protein
MCKIIRYIQNIEIKNQYKKNYTSTVAILPKEQYYSYKLSVREVNSEQGR